MNLPCTSPPEYILIYLKHIILAPTVLLSGEFAAMIERGRQTQAKMRTIDALNRTSFLFRVQTYKPSTWFAKPLEVSPLVCARKGWANIQRDVLRCTSCGALLAFDVEIGSRLEIDRKVIDDFLDNLSQAHDPLCEWVTSECPVEYEDISKSPRGLLLGTLISSLEALDEVWDLPKVEPTIMDLVDGDEEAKGKVERVLKWNGDTMAGSYADKGDRNKRKRAEISLTPIQEKERAARNLKLVSIAALGWKVRSLSCKVYVQDEDLECTDGSKKKPKKQWRQVRTKECTGGKGYVLGRQTILKCDHCSAQLGMWAFGSEPGIELLEFQRISARNTARALASKFKRVSRDHIETTELVAGTKEVEQMLDNTIAGGAVSKFGLKLESGVFGSAASSALFEAGTPASKQSRPSLETLLAAATPVQGKDATPSGPEETTDADAPVFGLGSYKKRKVEGSESVEAQLVKEDVVSNRQGVDVGSDDYVELVDGPPFDPLGQHRYFCPWRAGWKGALHTLVE